MKTNKRKDPVSLPHKPALLVIDVQRALFEKPTPIYSAEAVLENIRGLIARARRAGAPVVYVQHCNERDLPKGSAGWQLHGGLRPTSNDRLVEKRHGNAFEGTTLDAQLKALDVDTVVVAGLVTHGCVKATCQGAKALGYRVILAGDAHSSYSQKARELIQDWNQKLSAGTAEVKPASQVDFG